MGRRLQQLFADFPKAVWDPKAVAGIKGITQAAGLPFAVLSSPPKCWSHSCPAHHNTFVWCFLQTKLTLQTPIHLQSEKLPDPANSKNNIILIFMPTPGFHDQKYYLSSSRTYWQILDVLDPGSRVKNVFLLKLWYNCSETTNGSIISKICLRGFFAGIQLLTRTTFWFKSSLGHGN